MQDFTGKCFMSDGCVQHLPTRESVLSSCKPTVFPCSQVTSSLQTTSYITRIHIYCTSHFCVSVSVSHPFLSSFLFIPLSLLYLFLLLTDLFVSLLLSFSQKRRGRAGSVRQEEKIRLFLFYCL